MAEIINTGEIFLLLLALGTSLFTIVASSELTGHGFIRLIHSVIGGAILIKGVLHLTYANFINPQSLSIFLALIFCVLIYFLHKDKKSIFMKVLYVLMNALLIYNLLLFSNFDDGIFTFLFSSALLLGVITYSMILGHWYLVVPKLSERPLVITAIILWVILIPKVTFSSWDLLEHKELFNSMTPGYSFNMMMIAMRFLWGYLVIGVMSIFNYKLVKMRSIQSATGMLYAMTFFVLIGELISIYLYFNLGVHL